MIPVEQIPVEPTIDTRPFWIGVTLFIAALVMASVLVIAQGSNAGVRARTLVPPAGSTVSVNPAIEVLFARPVDQASIENVVRLSPEVPVDLSWDDNKLRILPRAALRGDTDYTVTIGPGVRDAAGDELAGELTWQFHTRQPRIAYIQTIGDASSQLWLTELSGEGTRQVSAPEQSVQDFDASRDGGALVYAVAEGIGSVNLWRADLQPQGLTRLTQEPDTLFGAPRFSPGGDLLAVEIRKQVMIGDQGSQLRPPHLELRRPLDGSPAGPIYGQGAQVGHTPRWSPDGTRIAFYESNTNQIGIFNFTSDLIFFPGESAALGAQAWAPDGRAITYTIVRATDTSAQQLVVVRDLQLGTENSLGESTGDQADPAWSPDGSLIAYAYQPPMGAPGGGGVWLMRPDGSGRIVLVAEPDMMYSQPMWSPDGEWLLFGRFSLTDPAATPGLWVIRRDGSELHKVADNAYQARWVP